jgi:hypothetical protein
MANEDLLAEIETLRAQLKTIEEEREAAAPSDEPESGDGSEADEELVASEAQASGKETAGELDLASQFKELLDTLDKDIKDAKPTTLLIIFALGVLVGRL